MHYPTPVFTATPSPYFSDIKEKLEWEGPDSKTLLAYRNYDPAKPGPQVAIDLGTAFRTAGQVRPWERNADPFVRANETLTAAFEFIGKFGIASWSFTDRHLAPEAYWMRETGQNLEKMIGTAQEKQRENGATLLLSRADLESHPRYQSGAAINPDPHVFAYAICQCKQAMDAAHALGGKALAVDAFPGRDLAIRHRDFARERDQIAKFLQIVATYAKEIGFKGELYLPVAKQEPVEIALYFLQEFGLLGTYRILLCLDENCQDALHKARTASQFVGAVELSSNGGLPTNACFAAQLFLELPIDTPVILKGTPGRESHQSQDLIYAYLCAIDALAKGHQTAQAIQKEQVFQEFLNERYADWDTHIGRQLLSGQARVSDCLDYIEREGEIIRRSGRQEMLQHLLNRYL